MRVKWNSCEPEGTDRFTFVFNTIKIFWKKLLLESKTKQLILLLSTIITEWCLTISPSTSIRGVSESNTRFYIIDSKKITSKIVQQQFLLYVFVRYTTSLHRCHTNSKIGRIFQLKIKRMKRLLLSERSSYFNN